MSFRPLSILLTTALAAASAGAGAAPSAPARNPQATAVPGADAIVTRTLPNGLKIVVWPDHDIPNVALYTWYRAGGRNEYPGITGVAHYFEHMMFNGTRTRKPGEFDRVMEAGGGANNAYTSNDVTVYQDWFPKDALDLVLELESDRMANLDFEPKVVESERGVVYSERRSSVDNNNIGALYEQLRATAYVAHPYQFPVIGWPSDIEGWQMEDLKSFYKTYYAPNNATMFVVGDVEPEAVLAQIERRFGAIPRQPAPDAVTTVEPEQMGERRLVLEKEGAQAPIVMLAYHAGREADAETRALELLVDALSRGESSRLHQRLVEREQVAVSVGSSIATGFDPGLVMFYAVLPPGGDAARVEALIDEELQKVAREGLADSELAKSRNQQLASFWRSLATISGKAQALGDYEVFYGDHRKLFSAPASFDTVTAAQLKPLAQRVFRARNRTVALLRPVAAQVEE
jgi:zinc protease